jgi:EamA domain-containing membrane protein RarD
MGAPMFISIDPAVTTVIIQICRAPGTPVGSILLVNWWILFDFPRNVIGIHNVTSMNTIVIQLFPRRFWMATWLETKDGIVL